MRLLVDGLVAYSQYFTIINEVDGPVSDEVTCPVERGISRPQFADADANSTSLGGEEEDTTGSANDGDGGDGGGISTSTLAVAIVIPIVVLLAILAVLVWLGVRRGWFVNLVNKHSKQDTLTHENTAGLTPSQPMSPVIAEKREEPAPLSSPPGELHSDHRAWEAEGREVYQLEGDERDARWGDGNMRGS